MESRRQPEKGVGQTRRTDWRRRRSGNLCARSQSFESDSTGPRVRHGLEAAPARPAMVLVKLNEHGPALKIFWTPVNGVGRQGGSIDKTQLWA